MSALSPEAVPVMPRGVRLHFDKVRETWVLLAPERALTLDMIGHAILSEVDGLRSFGQITSALAQKFDAPEEAIAKDASEFLNTLMGRRILEIAA